MSIQVKPEDFQNCFRCGEPILLIAYWDETEGKVGEIFVAMDFDYPWDARDYKNRLVVHEMEKALAGRHDLTCRKLPPAAETPEEETPWPKKRKH